MILSASFRTRVRVWMSLSLTSAMISPLPAPTDAASCSSMRREKGTLGMGVDNPGGRLPPTARPTWGSARETDGLPPCGSVDAL